MNPYVEHTILNADSIELVRMMYQRTISWVLDARGHLMHKRVARRSEAIMRAYAVLAELLGALRPEIAPELSRRLQDLYLYMQQRLLDSNMQQIDPPLAEVLELLITLDGAWSGVAAQLRPNKEASGRIEESPLEADTSRWPAAGQGGKYTARHTASA
jgi:flagellar secretion chaperone FliS